MKKMILMFGAAVCALGLMTGCGNSSSNNGSVDENKTPEAIKAEAANMDTAKIQAAIGDYTKAIEAKTQELEKVLAQLKEIPLKDQLGDDAKKLQAKAGEIQGSLSKLQQNLGAYTDALNKKTK